MNKKVIIGIGHKCRQGKDTVASFIKNLRPNTHILHFADALYDEVRNKNRKRLLIIQSNYGTYDGLSKKCYSLLSHARPLEYYELYTEDQVPFLHQIFTDRNIFKYWGMNEKDPLMLQFWGTQFRRNQHIDYWVNIIKNKIDDIILNSNEDTYIVIPDTRFLNEVSLIASLNTKYENCISAYVNVLRYNEDGSLFVDSGRDSHHQSEIELDTVIPFMEIKAQSGDLTDLKMQTATLLNTLEGKLK